MSHQQKCKIIDLEILLDNKFNVAKQCIVTAEMSTPFTETSSKVCIPTIT